MPSELEQTALAIGERFGSVHAFCQANPGLNRTTVYQVLRGGYKGNVGVQLGRIRAALEDSGRTDPGLPGLDELETVIREAACRRCPIKDVHLCRRCAPTHLQQAQAVRAFLEARAGG